MVRMVRGSGTGSPGSGTLTSGAGTKRTVNVTPTTWPSTRKRSASDELATVVAYDVVCVLQPGGAPQRFREAPWRLIARDLVFVLLNLWEVPFMFVPIRMNTGDASVWGVLAQVLAVVVSLILTVAVIVSMFLGLPAPILVAIVIIIFVAICNVVQGSYIRESKGTNVKEGTENEAWFL
jgi:hypothetical protein